MTARPSQLPFDLPHRPSLARDDLIVSPSNRLAVAAIDSWPEWRHPVLLVVGPAGSGKSHLAAAWAELAGAVRFPADVRAAGGRFAIVIDDIDRAADEAAIFDVVNAARLGGGFVLATARCAPSQMALGLADLRSRLGAATIVETGAPDDALLSGVLAKLFADRQIAVDPRLLPFLISRMERSLDAANRLVAAVDREALASKEKISRALLQRVLVRADGVFSDHGVSDEMPRDKGGEDADPAGLLGEDDAMLGDDASSQGRSEHRG